MKKILVLALAIVMALSVVALVACDAGETYEGECSYTVSDWYTTYGCKVKVTVKSNVITKVELVDYDEWVRTTADNGTTWTSHDKVEAAYPDFLAKFVGKTVDEVKAIKTTMVSGSVSASDSYTVTVTDKTNWAITGGTQSAARIICAVQNALSKIPA